MRCVVVVVGLLAACAEPDFEIDYGEIVFDNLGNPRIEGPVTAATGTPFTLTIYTGGNGCISVESTDIEPASDGVVVSVYDRHRLRGACIQPLLFFPHDATITFAAPGSRWVHVHGRRLDATQGDVIDVDYRVDVQ